MERTGVKWKPMLFKEENEFCNYLIKAFKHKELYPRYIKNIYSFVSCNDSYLQDLIIITHNSNFFIELLVNYNEMSYKQHYYHNINKNYALCVYNALATQDFFILQVNNKILYKGGNLNKFMEVLIEYVIIN